MKSKKKISEKDKKDLEMMDELLKNSELTEEDAERIGHKIKRAIRKRIDEK